MDFPQFVLLSKKPCRWQMNSINIQKKRFKANPEPSHCKWCPWEAVCVERQQQKATRREKRRWNRAERGEETLPSLSQSNEGSVMIGFGGKIEDSD
jgi:hypothetical protein